MAFILILCSIPDPSGKIYLSIEIQNLFHIPLFGVLAFLWMRTFKYNNWNYVDAFIHTLAITILYGIFTEFYQSFIPGRDPSMIDVVFNAIGALGGTLIYRYKK
jgi:VanZ family protein